MQRHSAVSYRRERWRTLLDSVNLVVLGVYAGFGYPGRLPVFHFVPWWAAALLAMGSLQQILDRAHFLPDLFEEGTLRG